MAKLTKSQKAAKTMGSDHMAKIGAKGGAKTAGTFATKRGLAKSAGIRSGMKRRLSMYDRKITELDERIAMAYRGSNHVPDDIKELEKTRTELHLDRSMLESEYNGFVALDLGDGISTEFLGQGQPE